MAWAVTAWGIKSCPGLQKLVPHGPWSLKQAAQRFGGCIAQAILADMGWAVATSEKHLLQRCHQWHF